MRKSASISNVLCPNAANEIARFDNVVVLPSQNSVLVAKQFLYCFANTQKLEIRTQHPVGFRDHGVVQIRYQRAINSLVFLILSFWKRVF